jgi:hypothetical protein
MIEDKEKQILDHLAMAWRLWLTLDDKHPDDNDEFRHPLHALQMLVAYRVAKRADPETFRS